MNKTVEHIDEYFQGLSWNQTFYGVPIQEGGYVWSNCLSDVLDYPQRIPKSYVIKSCWGKVRQKLIEHCEL